MPKILFSSPSPYSAKARMAATHAGYAFDSVAVDTGQEPDLLISANPLGKIPVLLTDDGRAVLDSAMILQFINREKRGSLYPANALKRTEAETLEALADGLADALIAHVYERRFRPEELVHQPWLDKQWKKATRALDHFNANPPRLTGKLTGGHIALRAALGYASLRFGGQWERGRAKLVRWTKKFDEKYPELAALLPK
ncbi:MAG: glutathione S-transferase family protein [Notoacmeibacter sp.]|nr:glutathione S-transferase family protein [Notoacmeibacter sp.]MCC0033097.1 glutathione S-transferase family protein [Brucellaceae bacterium]